MNLTPDQKDAITSPQSLAVTASAGTGKTTVLTQRFLYLHQNHNIPLSRLLAFTFTEKAMQEMQTRILREAKLKPGNLAELGICTLHAFCLRVVTRFANRLGITRDITLIDNSLKNIGERKVLDDFLKQQLEADDPLFRRLTCRYGLRPTRQALQSLMRLDLVSMDPSELVCCNPPKELPFGGKIHNACEEVLTPLLGRLKELQRQRRQERIAHGTLLFNDLETLTLDLFCQCPDVVASLQLRYRHILLDEAQDISPRQEKIIRTLFHPEHNCLFIVGDPKQAIYGFREANPACFARLSHLITQHGGREIILTETFRTPGYLQESFNQLFPLLLPSTSASPFTPMKSVPSSGNGGITIFRQDADAQNDEDESNLQAQMAQDILRRIQALILKGITPAKLAVLSNTHASLNLIEEKLRQSGISVQRDNLIPLMDDAVVNTLTHLLLYLAGNHDRLTQMVLFHSPCFHFSSTFVEHLAKSLDTDWLENHTLDLFALAHDRDTWHQLTQCLAEIKPYLAQFSAREIAKIFLSRLRLTSAGSTALALQTFLDLLDEGEAAGLYTVLDQKQNLMGLMQADITVPGSPASATGVALLTIHGAKGLEFDHVFLISGGRERHHTGIVRYESARGFAFKRPELIKNDGLGFVTEDSPNFLDLKARATLLAQDETRRLMYVALTRTRQSLYLYARPPAQSLLKKLIASPQETADLTTYNHWLYWFSLNLKEKSLTPESAEMQQEFHQPILPQEMQVAPISTPTPAAELPRFSVTALETFLHCPKRYELAFQRGIIPLDSSAVTHVVRTRLSPRDRGNLFHEILQFIDFQTLSNFDTVFDQALFNQRLADPDGVIAAECRLFLSRLSEDSVLGHLLISPDYRSEEEFLIPLDSFTLHGKIDRLCRVTSAPNRSADWWVIDYKTSLVLSDADLDHKTRSHSFQLGCYALAVSEIFSQPEVNTVILFTSGPHRRFLYFQPDQMQKFRTQLIDIVKRLQQSLSTGKFPLTLEKSHCTGCPYFKFNYCGVQSQG